MSSLIKLESLAGPDPEEIIQIDSGELTVGREPENAIVIDSDSVSRLHACFFEVLGNWLIRDMSSTNGTMVNGVKVQPGQIRLLRDGDLIQVANFPVRFSEVEEHGQNGAEPPPQLPPTLLIFSGESFETDFPLALPGAKFTIGGREGHLFLEGENPEAVNLEITTGPGHIELSKGVGGISVIVNGMAVNGVTNLADRDEIDIGHYKIIVNDPTSANTSKESRMLAAITAQKKFSGDANAIQANPSGVAGSKAWEWESEQAKRKLNAGRKFVFGSSPEDNVTGTIAMSRQELAMKTGEVSSAQRFQQSNSRPEPTGDPVAKEKQQVIFGVFVLLFIIGAAVYFFTSF